MVVTIAVTCEIDEEKLHEIIFVFVKSNRNLDINIRPMYE